jgi:hypothetical protein
MKRILTSLVLALLTVVTSVYLSHAEETTPMPLTPTATEAMPVAPSAAAVPVPPAATAVVPAVLEYPDRFMLRLAGLFITNSSTVFRLDSKTLPIGMYVDFADTLGGQSSTTSYRTDLRYRFNDRHAVDFSWYRIVLTGSKTLLDTELTIGDRVFPLYVHVNSEIATDIYKLTYQYSVFHNADAEIAGMVGFHVMNLGLGVSATDVPVSIKEYVLAPLPVLGVGASANLMPELEAYMQYQLFFINFENQFRGGLSDFVLGLEYRVIPNVAVGGAMNMFQMGLVAENERRLLTIKDSYIGMMAYLSLYL